MIATTIKTNLGDVVPTRHCEGFHTGRIESGAFRGQRAISNDGVTFLPAGEFHAVGLAEALQTIFQVD